MRMSEGSNVDAVGVGDAPSTNASDDARVPFVGGVAGRPGESSEAMSYKSRYDEALKSA